jgi:hypothetical protein
MPYPSRPSLALNTLFFFFIYQKEVLIFSLEKTPGKYFLVQYEHLSMYTYGTTQQIYSFVGRPLHTGVLQWLAKATKQVLQK